MNEKVDWKKFEKQDLETWNQIKDQLLKTHNMLLSSLEKMTDHKLSELVENKAYDYYTLLHGVIQHDIYHAGQISLLKK